MDLAPDRVGADRCHYWRLLAYPKEALWLCEYG